MSVNVTFLGAAGTVTGSKYLVEGAGRKILVDAGMFQGNREWQDKNWQKPFFDPEKIDAVLLTHAHIDHTGMLPRFYTQGLRCPVYATGATIDLCRVMLPDSGFLQEEEARYRRERGHSRFSPPLPLYTEQDAKDCLSLLEEVRFGQWISLFPSVQARWGRMGHILGAGSIQLEIAGKRITFSGDVGRYKVPILHDPQPAEFGDLLLIESTYGDKNHPPEDPASELGAVVNQTVKRGGTLLIPSFAVGRTQLLLYTLRELKEAKKIPDIPVIIDSPMAADATEIYRKHTDDYDEEALCILRHGRQPFSPSRLHFVRDRSESMKLNSVTDPMILISANGMLSGGRILHHLRNRISSPMTTVLLVGFQPPGGRGAALKSGAETLTIFKEQHQVRAHISEISSFSAHGDKDELLRWCRESRGTPLKTAVVHGEPAAAQSFKATLESSFGWKVFLPGYLETITL